MSFPCELRLVQDLEDDQRYRGSIHDDAVAQAQGFPAALVPGAFIYGHVSRLALQGWGEDWLHRGALSVRFRRPVFRGDRLTVAAGTLSSAGGMMQADVTVSNASDEVVAAGWVAMPEGVPPAPPPVDRLPLRTNEQRVEIVPGGMAAGMPISSAERELSVELATRSRVAFGETEPIYAAKGIAHNGCLMRLAMFDTNACFRFPAPVILTEAGARTFAPVRIGQRIATRGKVLRVWERNGRHYFESEEWMLANGKVAAVFRRTTIYARSPV